MQRISEVEFRALLVDAVTTVCHRYLDYQSTMQVDGLIGITLDDSYVVLVNLNKSSGFVIAQEADMLGPSRSQPGPAGRSSLGIHGNQDLPPPTWNSVTRERFDGPNIANMTPQRGFESYRSSTPDVRRGQRPTSLYPTHRLVTPNTANMRTPQRGFESFQNSTPDVRRGQVVRPTAFYPANRFGDPSVYQMQSPQVGFESFQRPPPDGMRYEAGFLDPRAQQRLNYADAHSMQPAEGDFQSSEVTSPGGSRSQIGRSTSLYPAYRGPEDFSVFPSHNKRCPEARRAAAPYPSNSQHRAAHDVRSPAQSPVSTASEIEIQSVHSLSTIPEDQAMNIQQDQSLLDDTVPMQNGGYPSTTTDSRNQFNTSQSTDDIYTEVIKVEVQDPEIDLQPQPQSCDLGPAQSNEGELHINREAFFANLHQSDNSAALNHHSRTSSEQSLSSHEGPESNKSVPKKVAVAKKDVRKPPTEDNEGEDLAGARQYDEPLCVQNEARHQGQHKANDRRQKAAGRKPHGRLKWLSLECERLTCYLASNTAPGVPKRNIPTGSKQNGTTVKAGKAKRGRKRSALSTTVKDESATTGSRGVTIVTKPSTNDKIIHGRVQHIQLNIEKPAINQFCCPRCQKGYKVEWWLRRHMKVCGNNSDDGKQKARKYVVTKRRSVSDSVLTLQPKNCGKTVPGKSKHIKISKSPNPLTGLFYCPQCDKTFQTHRCMKGHMQIHVKQMRKPKNNGPFCGQRKHGRCNVARKRLAVEPKSALESKVTGSLRLSSAKHVKISKKPNPVTGEYDCTYCQRAFPSMPGLRGHLKYHGMRGQLKVYGRQRHPLSGTVRVNMVNSAARGKIGPGKSEGTGKLIPKGVPSGRPIQANLKPDGATGQFHCPHCNKQFLRAVSMMSHTRIHGKQKFYRCGTCAFIFVRKDFYLNHLERDPGHVAGDEGVQDYAWCRRQIEKQNMKVGKDVLRRSSKHS